MSELNDLIKKGYADNLAKRSSASHVAQVTGGGETKL